MKTAIKKSLSVLLVLSFVLALLPTFAIPQASAATGYDRGYSGGRGGDGSSMPTASTFPSIRERASTSRT